MKTKIDVIEKILSLLGNVYEKEVEIPEELVGNINGRIHDELIREHNVLVNYDMRTKKAKTVKHLL
jgi:hypothetical protein